MEIHPDDPTTADDLTLVEAARAGDRLAFGVLYLRHHAAAWRVACVVSRFSPDAELAVIEGFTRVFSALPRNTEEFAPGGVSFRPYLLACVRQVALDRARTAGRADASPGQLAGLAPNGELVLSSLEHHVARGALAALPERSRTTLWLSEVEAMTPAEIGGLVGRRPEEITALVGQARRDLHTASQAILCGHEVRADCRFTVANLETYEAGTLESPKGVLVRSHLDICPACRMRLAAAVPAAPLLGGETQHHWLISAADVHPADRLLPPGLAAAAPMDLPMPARHLVAVAAGVPEMARRAGRTVRPVLPVMALVVAWVAVMVSLPQLMQPRTAAGPGGLAMPAVQAYLPGYQPGTTATRPTKTTAPATAGDDAGAAAGTELAVQFDASQVAAPAPRPAVKLVATARRTTPTTLPSPAQIVAAVAPITVAAAVEPAAIVPAAIVPAVTAAAKTKPAKQVDDLKRRLEKLQQKLRFEAASLESRRLDIASLRSKAREEPDGRVARREARRRHTGHAESA
jgi:DNA-directed RNA polymerase specialized sigma24 family protein